MLSDEDNDSKYQFSEDRWVKTQLHQDEMSTIIVTLTVIQIFSFPYLNKLEES